MSDAHPRRVRRGDAVFLRKTCPEHGTVETAIWRGAPDLTDWRRPKTPAFPERPITPIDAGCPYDCGLCPDHRQQTCTALLEVTQRCNLACPVCFAASGRNAPPDPDLVTIEGWYRQVMNVSGPVNIQLSGGEPTLRDDLPAIVAMGRELGFEFIQVNTNGIRLANDQTFVVALKEAGLASVFLQFDGATDAITRELRGAALSAVKIRAIEACAANEIGVVLVPTLVPGVNDDNVGAIIDFALEHMPTVRGVHFQPVSYFGRYPQPPADGDRITIPEVIRKIEAQTGGRVRTNQFAPPGCENALCSFHGNFVLMPGGELTAWTGHAPGQSSCCCTPESAAEGAKKARNYVARNWIAPGEISLNVDDPSLGGWDVLLERSRTHAFSISGMAFQDAWTLDLERLRDCCIHTVSPDGRIIPFCAYNLTDRHGSALYRGRDEILPARAVDRG